MPFQFADKAASKLSTVNLERQLLHYLVTDRLALQRTIGKHRSDFFTNYSRRFIYECAMRLFNEHHIMLSKGKFEFESSKIFDSVNDKARIEDLNAEYDLITSTTVTDSTESIIDSLEEVQLGNAEEEILREAYEKIKSGKYKEVANLFKQKAMELQSRQKEGRVINLHKDSDDWFEEVRNRHDNPQQYAGIQTGFEKFDKMTGGLFPAELTVVFGLSGKGKSTFMKALSCNMRKFGRVILHCGNEENEFQMRSKYMSADSGEKYSPFKRGTYTEDEYNRLKIFSDNARGVGAIYIYEFPQQTDVMWIERAYRYLEMQGVRVDVIVVDYLDLMKPVQQAYNENDEQGKVTSDLKQLAINCNCPVITATQAGTQSEKQEKKEKPFLTSADVFGTKRKVHSANTLIGIVNQTATAMANELDVKDRLRHHMVLCVPKNRDGAVFTFRQVMDVECGKFYEDTDGDNAMMNNLESQAMQMIDETNANGEIRAEISVKEMIESQKSALEEKAKLLASHLNAIGTAQENNIEIPVSSSSSEDPFGEEEEKKKQIVPSPIVYSDDDVSLDEFEEEEFDDQDIQNNDIQIVNTEIQDIGNGGSQIQDIGEDSELVSTQVVEEKKVVVEIKEDDEYNDFEKITPFDSSSEIEKPKEIPMNVEKDTGIKHKLSFREALAKMKKN